MIGREFVTGIAVGLVTAASLPLVLLAAAGTNPRVVTRTLGRTGDVLGGKARETLAELQEIFEDFMAEVRVEASKPRAPDVAGMRSAIAPRVGPAPSEAARGSEPGPARNSAA